MAYAYPPPRPPRVLRVCGLQLAPVPSGRHRLVAIALLRLLPHNGLLLGLRMLLRVQLPCSRHATFIPSGFATFIPYCVNLTPVFGSGGAIRNGGYT